MKAQIKKIQDLNFKKGSIEVILTEIFGEYTVHGTVYYTYDENTKNVDITRWDQESSTLGKKLENNSDAKIEYSNTAQDILIQLIKDHYDSSKK